MNVTMPKDFFKILKMIKFQENIFRGLKRVEIRKTLVLSLDFSMKVKQSAQGCKKP